MENNLPATQHVSFDGKARRPLNYLAPLSPEPDSGKRRRSSRITPAAFTLEPITQSEVRVDYRQLESPTEAIPIYDSNTFDFETQSPTHEYPSVLGYYMDVCRKFARRHTLGAEKASATLTQLDVKKTRELTVRDIDMHHQDVIVRLVRGLKTQREKKMAMDYILGALHGETQEPEPTEEEDQMDEDDLEDGCKIYAPRPVKPQAIIPLPWLY